MCLSHQRQNNTFFFLPEKENAKNEASIYLSMKNTVHTNPCVFNTIENIDWLAFTPGTEKCSNQ